jgi:sulfur carrier protein ThiS adenylyltransferase
MLDHELELAISARNMPGIQDKLKNGRVAIAGLGGLGSNIAVMLARIGVGRLMLVDFDKVEPSNLNRQHYNLTHLGMLKTDALESQIKQINPFTQTETRAIKITEDNAQELFKEYPIICEAFDDPQAKADLVNAMLELGGKKIVAASGMNGFGSANKIRTERKLKNLYVCGDSEPAEQESIGFMAPRVIICAGHQANMVLRLLLDIEEE